MQQRLGGDRPTRTSTETVRNAASRGSVPQRKTFEGAAATTARAGPISAVPAITPRELRTTTDGGGIVGIEYPFGLEVGGLLAFVREHRALLARLFSRKCRGSSPLYPLPLHLLWRLATEVP